MQRRQYLAAAGVTAGTVVAGCLDDGDDSDNGDGSSDSTDAPDDTTSLAGPIELTEAVLTAASQANVDRFRALLHPLNPTTDIPDEELGLGTLPDTEPEITVETRDPSVETVYAGVFRAEQTFTSRERQLRRPERWRSNRHRSSARQRPAARRRSVVGRRN